MSTTAAAHALPPLDPGRLAIVADAGAQIGAGHVMRTLALAEAWRARGGAASFVLPADAQAVAARVRGAGCDVQTELEQAAHGARVVIVDSYRDRDALVRGAAQHAPVVLVADDDGAVPDGVAFVVLPGPAWDRAASRARTLAGARFCLLRDEVRAHAKHEPNPVASRVAVTLGGGASVHGAAVVLDALDALDDALGASAAALDVELFVGPLAQAAAAHEPLSARASASRHRVTVLRDPPDFIDRIARADVCVSAGGTTMLELACMGVPTLAVVVADNQRAGVARLVELGAVRGAALDAVALSAALGALVADAAARRAMSARARALVDGDGPARVVQAVLGDPLRLRIARADDEAQLLSWRNDAATRAASFSSDPIDVSTHARWFARVRADASTRLYVAVDAQDTPVGQIRFERDADAPDGAEVSVALAPEARGRGLAAPLLVLGLANARAALGVTRCRARVKRDNLASVRAFARAGFHTERDDDGVLTMRREAR